MSPDQMEAMTECHAVAQMLIAYLDDEATAADAARIAAHLDICARCGLEADTVLALKVSTASAASGFEPDPAAVERLREFARALPVDGDDVTAS